MLLRGKWRYVMPELVLEGWVRKRIQQKGNSGGVM